LTPAQDVDLHERLRSTDWSFVVRTDTITDGERRVLSTPAFRQPSDVYGDATLYIRCTIDGPSEGYLEVYVVSGTYLSSKSVSADYRLDERPAAQNRTWGVSTDGDSAFLNLTDALALIEGMKTASTLNVRLRDFRGTGYDYAFSVKGFSSVYGLLRCQPVG